MPADKTPSLRLHLISHIPHLIISSSPFVPPSIFRIFFTMKNHPLSKWMLVIALPVIVALFYFSASLHFGYTPDDTYIYLRFAKNLVQGNGISFNPGVPSYGFTSPLWLFIISLGGAMGVDVYMAAKAIDLVFASLALIVFYLLSFELIRDAAVSVCATVAFSVNAWLMRWAGTGMETSL